MMSNLVYFQVVEGLPLQDRTKLKYRLNGTS